MEYDRTFRQLVEERESMIMDMIELEEKYEELEEKYRDLKRRIREEGKMKMEDLEVELKKIEEMKIE